MEAFSYCFKSETKTFYTLIEYIEIFLHKKALFVGFFKFRIRWLNRSPDHQQRSHIHEELTAERSPPKKMSALYDLLGYFFLFKRLKFYSIRKSKSWNNSVSEGETIKFNRQSSGVVEETWDILCNSFPPGQAVLGNFGHFCTIREGVFKCRRLNNSSKSHFKTWIHRHDGMFSEKNL